MLGAQALRTKQKAEQREREKRYRQKLEKERLAELQKYRRYSGDPQNPQHSAVLFDYAAKQAAASVACSNSARNHSIYEITPDGSLLALRRCSEKQQPTNGKIAMDKQRYSLVVNSFRPSSKSVLGSQSYDRIQALAEAQSLGSDSRRSSKCKRGSEEIEKIQRRPSRLMRLFGALIGTHRRKSSEKGDEIKEGEDNNADETRRLSKSS